MGACKKLWRKAVAVTDKAFVDIRRKQIRDPDFSIICNNCWGGYVYRRFGLPYNTPTVGLFFFADDFVKLCQNLRYYMQQELEFIKCTESRHRASLPEEKYRNVPIARLEDIEVVFLHYKSEAEAKEKWERRKERIHYDNLIFKFSKMNGCTQEHMQAFDALQVDKKILFVPYRSDLGSAVYFPVKGNAEEIADDTSEYSRYINLKKLINARTVCGRKYGV